MNNRDLRRYVRDLQQRVSLLETTVRALYGHLALNSDGEAERPPNNEPGAVTHTTGEAFKADAGEQE